MVGLLRVLTPRLPPRTPGYPYKKWFMAGLDWQLIPMSAIQPHERRVLSVTILFTQLQQLSEASVPIGTVITKL